MQKIFDLKDCIVNPGLFDKVYDLIRCLLYNLIRRLLPQKNFFIHECCIRVGYSWTTTFSWSSILFCTVINCVLCKKINDEENKEKKKTWNFSILENANAQIELYQKTNSKTDFQLNSTNSQWDFKKYAINCNAKYDKEGVFWVFRHYYQLLYSSQLFFLLKKLLNSLRKITFYLMQKRKLVNEMKKVTRSIKWRKEKNMNVL